MILKDAKYSWEFSMIFLQKSLIVLNYLVNQATTYLINESLVVNLSLVSSKIMHDDAKKSFCKMTANL